MAGEKRLSALAVRNAAPGVHADGGSLYLSVSKSGSRRWLYRYRSGASVKDLGLGDAAVISLADARTLRDKWRRELALGNDPIETRRAEKVQGVTFGEIADRVLEVAPCQVRSRMTSTGRSGRTASRSSPGRSARAP